MEGWMTQVYFLLNGSSQFLNEELLTDADLAAHIMIINNRGICISGRPIAEIFPLIPRADYLSSIMGDFNDCLENIEGNPIYCTLNLLRVYWYVKDGVISSKQEAGQWGLSTFPEEIRPAIKKVVECYAGEKELHHFEKQELELFKNYIVDNSELHGAFNK
ncbi:MAG: DUF4111 domain-containing protein [Lysinibacillus sp.]